MSANDNFTDLIPGSDVAPRSGGRRGPKTRRRNAREEEAPALGSAPEPQGPPRSERIGGRPARTEDNAGGGGAGGGTNEAPVEEDRTVGSQVLEPAEALARYLEKGARAKTAQTSFQLPPDRAVALQLMRQELRMQGFTAREASMSNIMAAMIDQWHERIFGRPIG